MHTDHLRPPAKPPAGHFTDPEMDTVPDLKQLTVHDHARPGPPCRCAGCALPTSRAPLTQTRDWDMSGVPGAVHAAVLGQHSLTHWTQTTHQIFSNHIQVTYNLIK